MSERIDESYGPFRIIAGVVNKTPQAIAYLGDQPVIRSQGEDPQSALQTVVRLVEEEQARRVAQRNEGVPTAEEYAEALAGLLRKLDETTIQQLEHHLRQREATVSLEALARTQRQAVATTQQRYASFGRALGKLLEFAPDLDVEREARPIAVFARVAQDGEPPQRRWSLRPEAAEGFALTMAKRRQG